MVYFSGFGWCLSLKAFKVITALSYAYQVSQLSDPWSSDSLSTTWAFLLLWFSSTGFYTNLRTYVFCCRNLDISWVSDGTLHFNSKAVESMVESNHLLRPVCEMRGRRIEANHLRIEEELIITINFLTKRYEMGQSLQQDAKCRLKIGFF